MTAFLRSRAEPFSIAGVIVVLAAALVGGVAAVSPLAAIGGMAAAGVLLLISFGRRMVPAFHVSLAIILVGYAFIGRGMAYIGVAPIYAGEVVLGLAAITILVSLPTARWRPIHLVLLLFMTWGLVRTVPYVGTYGINALRDAVDWGYALFAIAVSLTVRREHVERIIRLYARFIPWFVIWAPIAAIVTSSFLDLIPIIPGSDQSIIAFKGGDAGVHLGAIGAFMVLGLGTANLSAVRDWVIWAGWLVAVAVSGAINRGGLLAASVMTTSILFARATTRWFSLVVVGVFLALVVGLVNPQVDVGGQRRLSIDQVFQNALSVIGQGNAQLDATSTWRIQWWTKIVNYTIGGPDFWTGKGFGINLADDDGFQVNADHSLRSPHSAHLELLARGGVPMLALWILLQLTFAATLLRGALRARAAGMTFWVRVSGWLFVYWLAALVNSSFDVYLQGPMGGIWFWSVLGLGIAVAGIIERELAARSTTERRPSADPARTRVRPPLRAPGPASAGGSAP